MIQINATINGERKVIDLYGDEDITMDISFAEVQDITKRNSAFTQEFNIPGSKNNNDIFNHFYDFSVSTIDFDVREKFVAEITLNGAILYQGYIRLNRVSRTNNEIIYNVTFYSEVGDVLSNIGDKFLYDLDTTEWDHFYNNSIFFSYVYDPEVSGATSSVIPYINGTIYYSLLHKGYVYTGDTFDTTGINYVQTPILDWSFTGYTGPFPDTVVGHFDNLSTPVQFQYLTPSVSIEKLYRKIFSEAGYTITSDFFDTAYFKRYYLPLTFASDSIYLNQSVQPNYLISQTGDPISYSSYTFTNTIGSTTELSRRIAQINIINDNFGASTLDGTNTFILGTEGYYKMRIKFSAYNSERYPDSIPLDAYGQFKLRNQFPGANNDDITTGFTEYSSLIYGIPAGAAISDYEFIFNYNYSGGYNRFAWDYISDGNGDFVITDFEFEILDGPRNIPGGVMNVYKEFPQDQYTQLEFIQAINQSFNLLVLPVPNDPTTLRVEPIIDWIGKGQTLDWTDKVDRNSTIQVQPLTDMLNGTLEYKYQPDEGWSNTQFFKSNNKIFNDNNIKLSQDYKNNNITFQSILGSTIDKVLTTDNSGYGTIPYFYQLSEKEENEEVLLQFNPYRTQPKLLFRSNLMLTGTLGNPGTTAFTYNTEWYLESYYANKVWSNNNRFNTYPWGVSGFSHYTQYNKLDRFDSGELDFTNYEDLYDIYYKDYITDITSQDNRLVTCQMYFDPYELAELDFNEKILIDGTYFRINKISKYSLVNKGLCEVELVKLTKEYQPHRKIYYKFTPCSGGSVIYSNSDLQWSLFQFLGKIVKLKDGTCGQITIIDEPIGVSFDYIWVRYDSISGYWTWYIYDDCSCTVRSDEMVVWNRTTPTALPAPTQTPVATRTPTVTPTPSVTPDLCTEYTLENENPYSVNVAYTDCCTGEFRNESLGAFQQGQFCSTVEPTGDFIIVFSEPGCSTPCPSPTPTPSVTATITPSASSAPLCETCFNYTIENLGPDPLEYTYIRCSDLSQQFGIISQPDGSNIVCACSGSVSITSGNGIISEGPFCG